MIHKKIQEHQNHIKANILKGFYMDTPNNRKLGRVGQGYDGDKGTIQDKDGNIRKITEKPKEDISPKEKKEESSKDIRGRDELISDFNSEIKKEFGHSAVQKELEREFKGLLSDFSGDDDTLSKEDGEMLKDHMVDLMGTIYKDLKLSQEYVPNQKKKLEKVFDKFLNPSSSEESKKEEEKPKPTEDTKTFEDLKKEGADLKKEANSIGIKFTPTPVKVTKDALHFKLDIPREFRHEDEYRGDQSKFEKFQEIENKIYNYINKQEKARGYKKHSSEIYAN